MLYTFKIDKKLLPMKIHLFLSMASCASIIPFLSTILMQRGYSSVIVGLVFTLLPFPSLLIRPIVGAITDKYKCRKTALIAFIVINSLAVCVLMFIPGMTVKTEIDDVNVIKSPIFWLFFTTVTVLSTSITARSVLEITICIELLGENKYKYGEQGVWGAVGWGMMSFVSGLVIDWFSKGQDYKNYTPGLIIALMACVFDIYVASKIEVIQNTESKIDASDVKQSLTKISVLSFLFWVIAFGFFNEFIWCYLFWYLEDLSKIYHPETIPYIKTLEGLTQTVQCFVGDVPFFFLSSYILKRVDNMKVFSLMFFGFAVRFFLYSIITNPVCVLPVEILNGLTFALTYSSMTAHAAELSPVGAEGTFQGIVATAFLGIGTPIGSFVGGYIFDRFGSITSFKLVSGIALAICITQTTVNWLINRYSKDENFKENESSSDDPTIVGVVNDNFSL